MIFRPFTFIKSERSSDVSMTFFFLQERSGIAVAQSVPSGHQGSSLSPRPGMMNDDTPEYIKQRQGKRGEFRYF